MTALSSTSTGVPDTASVSMLRAPSACAREVASRSTLSAGAEPTTRNASSLRAYRRYFIVEDTGATKYSDAHHIDIYVGGEGTSAAASKKCMDPVTTNDGSPIPATINPPARMPVDLGPITGDQGCNVASGFGDHGNQ